MLRICLKGPASNRLLMAKTCIKLIELQSFYLKTFLTGNVFRNVIFWEICYTTITVKFWSHI